ncbi:unnamed protein product [Blepharisma stoltei]|uniref:Reverse transcriptase n=1 Tax=Blepharisma stoltei TaxID=1481888 RepID=A0AAU9JZS5_9CILI|nr:unnamed protein product [Blepharisma stoltei]
MLCSNSGIIKEIVAANCTESLPWEKKCKRILRELGLDDNSTEEDFALLDRVNWEKTLSSKILICNLKEVSSRIQTETEKTIRVWRWLKEGSECTDMPIFMKYNSEKQLAIGSIHKLRAGFNFSNHNAHMRHLALTGKCDTCSNEETEEHIIEDCPRYESLRARLLEDLEGACFPWREFRLAEVVLYSHNFEAKLKKWGEAMVGEPIARVMMMMNSTKPCKNLAGCTYWTPKFPFTRSQGLPSYRYSFLP